MTAIGTLARATDIYASIGRSKGDVVGLINLSGSVVPIEKTSQETKHQLQYFESDRQAY